MDKPVSLSRAIGGIWIILASCALVSIAERLLGELSPEVFLSNLAAYLACGTLPYQISRGRNWARHLYATLNVFCFGSLLLGDTFNAGTGDLVLYWLTLPVNVWIVACLFNRKAAAWFNPAA